MSDTKNDRINDELKQRTHASDIRARRLVDKVERANELGNAPRLSRREQREILQYARDYVPPVLQQRPGIEQHTLLNAPGVNTRPVPSDLPKPPGNPKTETAQPPFLFPDLHVYDTDESTLLHTGRGDGGWPFAVDDGDPWTMENAFWIKTAGCQGSTPGTFYVLRTLFVPDA